jgi:hypothetical protein
MIAQRIKQKVGMHRIFNALSCDEANCSASCDECTFVQRFSSRRRAS